MKKSSTIQTKFWNDNYVIDLDPIQKLLFLYFITNQQTNMLGVYELNIRKIAFETGIDKDMVLKILDKFSEDGKFSHKNGYLIIHNFLKHQKFNENMQKSAFNSYKDLPNSLQELDLIKSQLQYLNKIDLTLDKGLGTLGKGFGTHCLSRSRSRSRREVEVEVKEKENYKKKNDYFLSDKNKITNNAKAPEVNKFLMKYDINLGIEKVSLYLRLITPKQLLEFIALDRDKEDLQSAISDRVNKVVSKYWYHFTKKYPKKDNILTAKELFSIYDEETQIKILDSIDNYDRSLDKVEFAKKPYDYLESEIWREYDF